MSIRRACSSIVSLAIRWCGSPKSCNRSISSALNFHNRRVGSPLARFSTDTVDDDIAQLIISDNQSYQKSPNVEAATHIPNIGPIPFNGIYEEPEEGAIYLIRTSEDEIINVAVRTCREENYVDDYIERYEDVENIYEMNEEDEVQSNGETDKIDVPYLYMTVKIYYGPEYLKRLKFFVIAFRDQLGQIGVRSMIMSMPTSHLTLFNEYLKDRGFEPDTLSFLRDYVPVREQLYLKTLKELSEAKEVEND